MRHALRIFERSAGRPPTDVRCGLGRPHREQQNRPIDCRRRNRSLPREQWRHVALRKRRIGILQQERERQHDADRVYARHQAEQCRAENRTLRPDRPPPQIYNEQQQHHAVHARQHRVLKDEEVAGEDQRLLPPPERRAKRNEQNDCGAHNALHDLEHQHRLREPRRNPEDYVPQPRMTLAMDMPEERRDRRARPGNCQRVQFIAPQNMVSKLNIKKSKKRQGQQKIATCRCRSLSRFLRPRVRFDARGHSTKW